MEKKKIWQLALLSGVVVVLAASLLTGWILEPPVLMLVMVFTLVVTSIVTYAILGPMIRKEKVYHDERTEQIRTRAYAVSCQLSNGMCFLASGILLGLYYSGDQSQDVFRWIGTTIGGVACFQFILSYLIQFRLGRQK